jgi:hypothetical protein
MINFNYDRTTNTTLISVNDMSQISNNLPLTLKLKNIVTDEIHYQVELNPHSWARWSGAELITDILVYDSTGKLIFEKKWDVTEYGDLVEKDLWYYLTGRQNKGLKSNGLVIGTHDGRNGHWIYPIKHKLSTATLIDGSDKQYVELVNNYQNKLNVKTKNLIVTTDGSDVEWYQGGEGYTDTVVKDLIVAWVGDDNVTKSHRPSISLNQLMTEEQYDWLHLDVEGIDGDLILSLEQRPNVIIYESMNLPQEMVDKLNEWFSYNEYVTITENGNTIAKKIIK